MDAQTKAASAGALKKLLSEKWPQAIPAASAQDQTIFRTGVPEFNQLLPDGGLPRGQWLEITGEPGSGKTGLLFALLAGCAPDELILYLDLPRQFFPAAARAAGVRLSQVRWLAPAGLHSAMRIAEAFLTRQRACVVVFDLVGQKSPMPQAWVHRLRQETVRCNALFLLLTEPPAQVVPASTVALRVGVAREGAACTLQVIKSRLGGEGAKQAWTRGAL
jgi:hypothetical protein